MIKIKLLPAHNGDSIVVSCITTSGQIQNIFIDTGTANCYKSSLKKEILALNNNNQAINLLIITHIDSDHIGGLIKFVEDIENGRLNRNVESVIKKYWFNSGKIIASHFGSCGDPERLIPVNVHSNSEISVKQGKKLEDFLLASNKWHQSLLLAGQTHAEDNITLTILSPDESFLYKLNNAWHSELINTEPVNIAAQSSDYKERIDTLSTKPFIHDTGIPNGSSIAFLADFDNKKILLLGDAYPSIIVASLLKLGYSIDNKLQVDCVKISHHGSKHNTNYDLLSLIECKRFLISSNGLNRDKLPNKEALSRILCNPFRNRLETIEFYFNYDNIILREIFSEEEKNEYNFQCLFPQGNICELTL